jgi:hypothetical protein
MPHDVCSFLRVSGWTTELRSGYSRVGALAAAPQRLLQGMPVDLHAAADPDVVDRHAGVLAQQVVGLLGDADVGDHGGEHLPRGAAGLRPLQAAEAALDVRRQHLQGADVELLGRVLDRPGIDLHH